ncbi:ATP synthase subunit I [Paralcaligenes sp. KSB-10]|uniref:ATP synthase subunit I n=1 Tax=Paralcaligenes sp. KSB-10 TaxID=2901142 RepID=UPI001E389AFF|nr:ATP synthase subunit I [Paralcaligenes sp. KSB-10]UHL63914.1 ATP synthase subunit I [Paralcaligenes sp. KSB-10]
MPPGFKPGIESEAKLELSEADRAALVTGAGRGVVRALMAQLAMGGFGALLSWVVAGSAAGLSALMGAGAYFVPNVLFAVRVLLGLYGPGKPSELTFFLGEAFKLASTLLLLGLAVHLTRGWLVWPAFLLGLLCVLKGYVLLLLPGRRW